MFKKLVNFNIVRQMFLIVHVEVANRGGKEKNDPKPKRDEISS